MTTYGIYRRQPPSSIIFFGYICTAIFLLGLLFMSTANGDLGGDTIFISIVASGMFLVFVESVLRSMFPRT